MSVFKTVVDWDLVRYIGAARHRLVYVAPGVSTEVADALVGVLLRAPQVQTAIVLDGSEECCRLGYCDAPALKLLSGRAKDRSVPIRHHAGLRLGLLMSDDDVLLWSPTPLMFEAPRSDEESNGILLTPQTVAAIAGAVGADAGASADKVELGTETLTQGQVDAVVEAIKAAPPAPFDLTRLALVFSAKFQFVETVLRGAELIKREIRLDSLIVNSDAPEELRPLLQTKIQPFTTDADKAVETYVIVNGDQAFRRDGSPMLQPAKQADVHACWADLTNRYIVSLPGFGRIIRHSDKARFEASKEAFEKMLTKWVAGFRDLVKAGHDLRVRSITELIERRMAQTPAPKKLTRTEIENLVLRGLDRLRVIEPSVKVVYKNITVESARDDEFLDALKKALPKEELKGWFQVFEAARVVEYPQGSSA